MDLNLLAKGLEMKQTQFDTNYAALQKQIDAVASLDILKKADQTYVADRVSQVIDSINNYGVIDLSSSSVTRQVSGHIKQVLDDNVKTALASTKKYRAFQDQMQQLQKTNKGAYSRINEMYASKHLNNYLLNDKVGQELEDFNYLEYRDVNEKVNKKLLEIFKNYGITENQIATEDPMTYLETKVKGIEREKIRNTIEASLDAGDRQQLAINGWYNYGLQSNDAAAKKIKEYSDQRIGEVENIQKKIKEKLEKGDLNQTEKDALKAQISFFDSQIESYKGLSDPEKGLKTAEEVGGFLEKERLIGHAQEIYEERVIGKKYTLNEVEFRKNELLIEQLRADAENRKSGVNDYDEVGVPVTPNIANSLDGEMVSQGVEEYVHRNESFIDEINTYDEKYKVRFQDGTINQKETLQKLAEEGIDITYLQKEYESLTSIEGEISTKFKDLETTLTTKLGNKEEVEKYVAYLYKNADSDEKPALNLFYKKIKGKNSIPIDEVDTKGVHKIKSPGELSGIIGNSLTSVSVQDGALKRKYTVSNGYDTASTEKVLTKEDFKKTYLGTEEEYKKLTEGNLTQSQVDEIIKRVDARAGGANITSLIVEDLNTALLNSDAYKGVALRISGEGVTDKEKELLSKIATTASQTDIEGNPGILTNNDIRIEKVGRKVRVSQIIEGKRIKTGLIPMEEFTQDVQEYFNQKKSTYPRHLDIVTPILFDDAPTTNSEIEPTLRPNYDATVLNNSSSKRREEVYNALIKKIKDKDIKNINTTLLKELNNNPTNFAYRFSHKNGLSIVKTKDKDDVVFNFDSLYGQDKDAQYQLYSKTLHTPYLIQAMLAEIYTNNYYPKSIKTK